MKYSIQGCVFVFIFCFPCHVRAQKIRLVNATDQSWSGGVAGRSGNDYTFVIEFSDFRKQPLPDTIWIGSQPVGLYLPDSLNGGNMKIKHTKQKTSVIFEIKVSTSVDEYSVMNPLKQNEQKNAPAHIPTYKGFALLSYHCNGRQQHYVIRNIPKNYPPINYP